LVLSELETVYAVVQNGTIPISWSEASVNDVFSKILFLPLFVTWLWDGFTTGYVLWLHLDLKSGMLKIAVSVFLSLLMMLLLTTTKSIMDSGDDLGGFFKKLMWVTAMGSSAYSSWVGNQTFIVSAPTTTERMAVLIVLTILVSVSPVMLSYLNGD
jgi:hypothetical protein